MSSGRAQSVPQLEVPPSTREEHGTFVISVTGALNAELLSKLHAEFHCIPLTQPVIVNLNALTLGSASVLGQLMMFLRSLPGCRVCLVCDRLSARRLLRFAGAADIVPVFITNADAIQVLLFHQDGYGPGWSISMPTAPTGTLPGSG